MMYDACACSDVLQAWSDSNSADDDIASMKETMKSLLNASTDGDDSTVFMLFFSVVQRILYRQL